MSPTSMSACRSIAGWRGSRPRAISTAFAAELIDRFGPLPNEVRHLFEIVTIKQLAKQAGVEKIDAGPKGGTIAFRGNSFANPVTLIDFINQHSGTMKVRPDQKIVVTPRLADARRSAHGRQGAAAATGEAGDGLKPYRPYGLQRTLVFNGTCWPAVKAASCARKHAFDRSSPSGLA